MGLLDGILGNETVQRLAFGQLKGLFGEKGLDFILVRLDAEGEIELEMYKKGEGTVVPIPEGLSAEQVRKGVAQYAGPDSKKDFATPERLSLGRSAKKKGGK